MKELARRIDDHLKRLEADPEINKRHQKHGLVPYYCACAYYSGGAKIGVTYVSFQGASMLTRGEATKYLAWLDAGNVGKHWTALRELDGK